MPAENIMKTVMEGAASVPTGRGRGTFKAQSQSGMLLTQPCFPIKVRGKEIPMAEIAKLMDQNDFKEHKEACKHLGFELLVKRAKIGSSKHVRVRAELRDWSIEIEFNVFEEAITLEVLKNILEEAGRYKGLGDWRPSSPKSPGYRGTFRVETLA
jgi:hypothetical protein